jgi:hypothetical protein
MTRSRVFAATLLLLTSFALAGCGDDDAALNRVKEETGEAWDAIKAWSAEKKDRAVEVFAERKEAVNESYMRLKEKSADWSEERKRELEAGWRKVESTYQRAETATAEGWNEARDAFVAAYEAFEESLEDKE